ncbi:MAG: HAMP domain-containing histidine kinase [Clostridia bacterium]|nr:HAMP domain-containing histidine kinase [Clostridia bacterium]
MKISLRLKFFAGVSGLIAFFVIVCWLSNNLFLERFYLTQKKYTLLESYKNINSIYKDDSENTHLELEKLESARNIQIIIFNEYEIKYISNARIRELRPRWQGRMTPHDRPQFPDNLIKSREEQIAIGRTIIENIKDDRLNASFIRLYSRLEKGDYVYISTPVAAIKESVQTTNSFFLLIGLLTLFFGTILVFFFTGKFTGPILELKDIAQRMSSLDFSRRYNGKTTDEIGELGRSINSLSEQLQKSILELKAANEKLIEDIEHKNKIDEMRKEFIASVSHELKTPISLIQGYALGLKLNVNKEEQNKNFYCDVIMEEGVKVNKLVKQLLELAQIESGAIKLDRTDFMIDQLVDDTIKKNEILFKDKEVNIELDVEEGIPVNADYDKTEQILMNYLSNALNHVDDNKKIRVTVRRLASKAIVRVYNSGEHIPKDSLDKIWASFYKVDKARTRAYGGSGLGLSIVRAIQEMHHNKYGVENVDGGVEFWFDIDAS